MKQLSVFDVIGPAMIGPSSSHTAGALRIAAAARKMLGAPPVWARLTLMGSFAQTYRGHGTDRALVAGLLGFGTEDERICSALELAEAAGLEFTFVADKESQPPHPNTVKIEARTAAGRHLEVVGVSTGGGAMRIDEVDGVQVSFTGEYCTIIVEQMDEPGIIKHISGVLGDAGINIAFMKVYREAKGQRACTIVETDQPVGPDVLASLGDHTGIRHVALVEI